MVFCYQEEHKNGSIGFQTKNQPFFQAISRFAKSEKCTPGVLRASSDNDGANCAKPNGLLL